MQDNLYKIYSLNKIKIRVLIKNYFVKFINFSNEKKYLEDVQAK